MAKLDPALVRQAPKDKGMSQESLAKAARLNKQMVNRWEKGRDTEVRPANLERLCRALICRAEALDLAGGHEDLALAVLCGLVLIREIPRELLQPEAVAARVAWLRPKVESALEAAAKALKDDLFGDSKRSEPLSL